MKFSLKILFSTALLSTTITTFAADKPTLNVYTYDSFSGKYGPGAKLEPLFEQQCNCDLQFVAFDDTITMFNRIRLDGKKSKADVLVGIDNHLIDEAEKSGLFATNNVDLSQLQLPITWQNNTFLPYDFAQFAFIYDKTKLSNPPKSLAELVTRQDLKVIYQDPRTSSVGRGLLIWLNSVYPQQQVAQAWQDLAKHTVTVAKGWSATYGAFLKGESDLVLSYNTSPLYHQLNDHTDQYVATQFSEGGLLQIEVAAKLKQSKQPELADRFLAFLLTPEAQKIIALHNVMLPVTATNVGKEYEQLRQTQLSVPTLTPNVTQANTQQWVETWQQALTQ